MGTPDPAEAAALAELAARVEAEQARPAAGSTPLDRLRAAALQALGGHGADCGDEAAALLAAFDRVRDSLAIPQTSASQAADPADFRSAGALHAVAEFAHDLRSPLTSILFLAGALREGHSGPLTDTQRRQVGIIYSAALGMVSMASDMIELHRTGEEGAEASPFSLRGMFESVRDVVAPLAEEKRIEVRLVTAEPDHRYGNSLALGRVLLNLAVNALKSTEEGWVEIAAEADGPDRLRFHVADTGPGIDAGSREGLFDVFRPRPGTGSYGFSGSGLGLGICRKLVGEMGGELALESAIGQGSRFWFVLDVPAATQP